MDRVQSCLNRVESWVRSLVPVQYALTILPPADGPVPSRFAAKRAIVGELQIEQHCTTAHPEMAYIFNLPLIVIYVISLSCKDVDDFGYISCDI